MAKEQVLGYKPAPRLEQVDDEHFERVEDCEHRPQSCDDSLSRRESLSRMEFSERTRIFKIRGQRPTQEIRRTLPEFQKKARRRPAIVSITRGNVAQILASETWPPETALPGWGGRIRTSASESKSAVRRLAVATPSCQELIIGMIRPARNVLLPDPRGASPFKLKVASSKTTTWSTHSRRIDGRMSAPFELCLI
jgi:hypothetical protein